MLKRIYYDVRFKAKHFPNLLVRFFTRDKYYICEECHKIHKRDGTEIRLDDDKEHLMSHPLWYGSVCRESYNALFRNIRRMIREDLTK